MFEKTKKFVKNHEDEVIALSSIAVVMATSAVLGGAYATHRNNKGWTIKDAYTRKFGDETLLEVHFKNGRAKYLKQTDMI